MSSNITRIKKVAQGLGNLCDRVVFVGGSVAELYADDPAATEIRPTLDVDCVIGLASYLTLQEFEGQLRRRGFVNDIASGVICRWIYDDEIVDLVPDSGAVLGFTNQWYRPGFQHRISHTLPDGTRINIIPPLYYLATKIEAIKGRGGDDLRLSHDFEDFVYILNNRLDIVELFDNEHDNDLVRYISSWAAFLLSRSNCREEIECMLPYGDYDRIDYIINILKHFKQ